MEDPLGENLKPFTRGALQIARMDWTEEDDDEEEEKEVVEKRNWEEIDENLLIAIFQKLDIEDLLLGVPLVCQSWYAMSQNPLCWMKLDLHMWEKAFHRFSHGSQRIVLDFTKLLRFVVDRSHENLRSIVFPRRDITDGTLLFVARRCPRLKSLDFQGRCDVSKDAFCKALCSWKELEVIDIITPPLFCKEIVCEIGRSCENFLQLRTRGLISEEEVLAVATKLPKLKVLNLSSSSLTNEGLLAILGGCKSLEFLDVTNCSGIKLDDEILEKASRLKDFKYGSVESDDDEIDPRPVRGIMYEEYVFGSDGSCHGEVHVLFH